MSVAFATALAAAAFLFAIGLWRGTYAAADTDPYGYVSQADLIAAGSLRQELPPTAQSLPGNEAAFAPAGYTLTADKRFVVPVYPPGLPALMGWLQRITGDRTAVFYVVPALAALLVLTTFFAGVRCDGPATGAIAALLLATSPVVIAQTVQPVSDVPAAAWWTLAMALALCDSAALCFLAGASASLAVLTRPHLVPIAAVIGLHLVATAWRADPANRPRQVSKLAWFVAGGLPGCLIVAALNVRLHGSPFLSGYGPLREYFRWEHLAPNLDRYPRWLLQTHSPFVYLAFAWPMLLRSRLARGINVGAVWVLWSSAVVVVLLTLFYGYFGRDEWGYVRFLLPALPALLILSAAVARRMTAALISRSALARAVALALVAGGLSLWQLREAERRGVFALRDVEQRYVDVGQFIAGTTAESAAFVSGLHSGSIRYYANRTTIYYPRLRRGSLDLAVRAMQQEGRDVFIVLEDGERSEFRSRFEGSALSRLDWPPAQQTSRGVPVSIWNPRDRDAFLAGVPIVTGDIQLLKNPTVTGR